MNSKLLVVFLFLALLALVVDAQKNDNSQGDDQTNVIDQCIKKYNCAPSDRKCRAACAGVPSGDRKVAIDTQSCYTKCHDDNPTDVPAYTTCINGCKKNVYQEGVTEPGSAVPKANSQDGGQSSSTDGGDKSDNSNDTNADNSTQSDNNGNEKKDSGAILVSKSVLVYVFAAVLACAAFTAGL